MLTPDVHSICYGTYDIFSHEIRKKIGVGEKNPLLTCRCGFDKNIEIHSSGERTNARKKRINQKSLRKDSRVSK